MSIIFPVRWKISCIWDSDWALALSPGQPYNQLAILASSKGDHLTTIFYYCRSIAVKFPFPAASTNLQKALSKALERSGGLYEGYPDLYSQTQLGRG